MEQENIKKKLSWEKKFGKNYVLQPTNYVRAGTLLNLIERSTMSVINDDEKVWDNNKPTKLLASLLLYKLMQPKNLTITIT